jgi:hypothetical protein
MAFAQLTYRESLRDIEACLSAQAAKLYHMGFRQEIKRSTLADANEARDWRVHAAFAGHLDVCCIINAARVQIRSATLINRLGGRDALASEPLDRQVKVARNEIHTPHPRRTVPDCHPCQSGT